MRWIPAAWVVLASSLGCQSRPASSAADLDESSFRSLFDGRSLQGWVTRGGHYDGDAAWTVEDGAITGRQGAHAEGGLLYTERPYTSFMLALDVKMDWPFDSGVFVHMAPRGKGAQVTLDYRPDGEIAGVYSDGWLRHNEGAMAKWKKDQWNHFVVRCTCPQPREGAPMHLEAWLNGEQVTDYELPAGAPGHAPTGLIGLQVHGGRDDPKTNKVQFKNVRIRELELPAPALGVLVESQPDHAAFIADRDGFQCLTPSGFDAGWRALFDGGSLEAWDTRGAPESYQVRDSVIAFLTKGSGDYLATKADFTDFELRLDFKIGPMANSGVFLRGLRGGGDPAYSGCEIQILDDFDWEKVTGTKLHDWQLCGSLYGAVPPKTKALAPLGSWNNYRIVYQGSHLTTFLNDKLLYDVDTLQLDAKPPFAERAKSGFIGLQRHGAPQITAEAYAWFRNIWVKRLEPGR